MKIHYDPGADKGPRYLSWQQMARRGSTRHRETLTTSTRCRRKMLVWFWRDSCSITQMKGIIKAARRRCLLVIAVLCCEEMKGNPINVSWRKTSFSDVFLLQKDQLHNNLCLHSSNREKNLFISKSAFVKSKKWVSWPPLTVIVLLFVLLCYCSSPFHVFLYKGSWTLL